jgi:hypothetical protein
MLAADGGRDARGGALQVRLPQPVYVREVRRLAADDAYAGASLRTALHPLHARFVDRETEPGAVLAKELGEVSPVAKRPLEHLAGELGVDQGSGVLGGHHRASALIA